MIINHEYMQAFIEDTKLRQKEIAERVGKILGCSFHPNNITNYLAGRDIPVHIQHALVTVLSDIENDGFIWSSYAQHKIERFIFGFDQNHGWVAIHNGYPHFMVRVDINIKQPDDNSIQFEAKVNDVIPIVSTHTQKQLVEEHMEIIERTVKSALQRYQDRVQQGFDAEKTSKIAMDGFKMQPHC